MEYHQNQIQMQILLAEERVVDLAYDKAFAAMVELSKKREETEATFYKIDDEVKEARATLKKIDDEVKEARATFDKIDDELEEARATTKKKLRCVAIKQREAMAKMNDLNEDHADEKNSLEDIEFRRAMKKQQIDSLKKGVGVVDSFFFPKKPW